MRAAFDAIDKDGDGQLTVAEVHRAAAGGCCRRRRVSGAVRLLRLCGLGLDFCGAYWSRLSGWLPLRPPLLPVPPLVASCFQFQGCSLVSSTT